MSLDPPTYIFALQNNIRARPISWEGAVRAKTITDADLKKIKSIDKVRKEQRKSTIESDVDSFVALLLGGSGSQSIFEAAAKRPDIIQYMLVLTGDLIDGMAESPSVMELPADRFYRYPKPYDGVGTAPGPVQALPSTAESVAERRRCSPAPYFLCSLEPPFICSHARLEELLSDRPSPSATIQLPVSSRQEL